MNSDDSRPSNEIEEGYSISALCHYIGITPKVFEYWRQNLDIDKKRKKNIFQQHLLVYRVMKEFVEFGLFSIPSLKKLDWNMIFEICDLKDLRELKGWRLVYDKIDSYLYLMNSNDSNPDRRLNEMFIVSFDEMLDAHYKALVRKYCKSENTAPSLAMARFRKQTLKKAKKIVKRKTLDDLMA